MSFLYVYVVYIILNKLFFKPTRPLPYWVDVKANLSLFPDVQADLSLRWFCRALAHLSVSNSSCSGAVVSALKGRQAYFLITSLSVQLNYQRNIQSTLVISTSLISNNRLFRRSNFASFPQYLQYISNLKSQNTYSFVRCDCSIYFSSLLQIRPVEVRVSRKIAENPLDFETRTVNCTYIALFRNEESHTWQLQ